MTAIRLMSFSSSTIALLLAVLCWQWMDVLVEAQAESNSSQCPAGNSSLSNPHSKGSNYHGVEWSDIASHFSSYASKSACQGECNEAFFSLFTYPQCTEVNTKAAPCTVICGQRLYLWVTVGVLCVFAAAVATLVFTLPMCAATCASCLHSKKASTHSRKVYAESQQQQPGNIKDQQQLATYSYNPYAYWPYYGRT